MNEWRNLDPLAPAEWGLMAADIHVDDDRVVVRLEAPGMRREDLRIDIPRLERGRGRRIAVQGD
jgi:HSP20 family molecular chaperone IbpA